jgi:hypothetical protein
LEHTPTPRGGDISCCHWGKRYEKGKRIKGDVKTKGRKGKEKSKWEVKG